MFLGCNVEWGFSNTRGLIFLHPGTEKCCKVASLSSKVSRGIIFCPIWKLGVIWVCGQGPFFSSSCCIAIRFAGKNQFFAAFSVLELLLVVKSSSGVLGE